MFPHGAQKALGWFGGPGFSGTMNMFTGTCTSSAICFACHSCRIRRVNRTHYRVLQPRFRVWHCCDHARGRFHGPRFEWILHDWAGNQKGEGFEYHLLAMGLALVVIISGAGKWSIDRLLTGRLEGHRVSTN